LKLSTKGYKFRTTKFELGETGQERLNCEAHDDDDDDDDDDDNNADD
jgi:hypothetical protein